jgi:IS5 family transposase
MRKGKVTDGARFDGRMHRDVVTGDNTASDVWADTAYRSQTNEKWLKAQGRVSRIHRKKPGGKPMPDHVRRGNAKKSKVRARVEHVFARQKDQMGLFIRTIGIKRAEGQPRDMCARITVNPLENGRVEPPQTSIFAKFGPVCRKSFRSSG